MDLIKGYRFNLPLVWRVGFHKDKKTHRVRWHSHPGIECHFVLKGRFSWELKGNPHPCTVPGGTFIVLPPKVPHRALDEDGTPSERVAIIFNHPDRQMTAGSSYDVRTSRHLFDRLQETPATPRSFSRPLDFLLRQLLVAMKSFDPTSEEDRLHLKLLHEHILLETVRARDGVPAFPHDGTVIPKICDWIREHQTEEISAERLAQLSGYGRSRFFELFLRETGLTPRDFLLRTRIERARRQLLKRPDTPVGEIARRSGFRSAVHFSIAFRKHVGKSPSAFRRETRPASASGGGDYRSRIGFIGRMTPAPSLRADTQNPQRALDVGLWHGDESRGDNRDRRNNSS